MADDDDELGPVGSMAVGAILLLIGLWLFDNSSGYCVTLVFLDSCILSGSTFGLLMAGLGGLSLLGGYTEYQEQEGA